MKKDLNTVFDELVSRYVKTIEKDYQSRYKRAKDTDFIKEELKKGTDFIFDWTWLDTSKGKLIETFAERYKRGEDIEVILNHIRKQDGEIEDILKSGFDYAQRQELQNALFEAGIIYDR